MKEKLSKKEWDVARKAIQRIALQERKTVEQVRKDIKLAMLCGLLNNDPQVQAMWKSIPCEGEYPEPEELIAWVAKRVTTERFEMPNHIVNPL